MVLFPINNPLYLCLDPSELQRLRSNGNQSEISSLSSSPLLSKRPAAEGVAGEWQLFGNATWNMLTACQGTLPWGVEWRAVWRWHHLPFSWSSAWSPQSNLIHLPHSDISSCRGVPKAFTLLYTHFVLLLCWAYLSSSLSASGSGLGLTSKQGGVMCWGRKAKITLCWWAECRCL